MKIVPGTVPVLIVVTDTTLFQMEQQNYCRIFECPIQSLPDHLGQCKCYLEMKIGPISTDLFFNMHLELSLRALGNDQSSEQDNAEATKMRVDFMKLEDHSNMSYSPAYVSF